MNSGSVWESLSQLIFRSKHNISHLHRQFIMNFVNVFHKTNKMKLSTDEYTQQCWVKGQMGSKGGFGVWFRASFGNRRARPRNVGSMKWYFLKQKKSKFRNRVNSENSWTLLGWPPQFLKKKTFDFQVWISQLNTMIDVWLWLRDCDC